MSMMQATAMSRTVRALNAKSSPSGRDLYKPGDFVDIRRDASSKDAMQWRSSTDRGPLVVKENRPHDGQVFVITDKNKEVRCRYQDVRHTLLLITEAIVGRACIAAEEIRAFALAKKPGCVTTIGWIHARTERQVTKDTVDHP